MAKTPKPDAMSAPSKYIVDLDGTLTVDKRGVEYAEKPLNTDVAKAVAAAMGQGYGVEVFTARGMNSLKGDLAKIEAQTKPIASNWLKGHKVPHDNLIMGKVWCGPHGFYVDDKNLHLEEFVFRTTGPFAGQSVDIVIPFYNEELNVEHVHGQQKRLERLLEVRRYIYVNNGSRDATGQKLDELAAHDPKVQVVHIQANKGYGFGLKSGILAAQADWVMTNHADGQFDGYTFLMTHMLHLQGLAGRVFSILPRRLNRPQNWVVRSLVLRLLASALVGKKLGEFNGQPKMWRREALHDVGLMPDDFCFDLAVYLALQRGEVLDLPILEKGRFKGTSSWAGQMRRTWRLSFRYLQFAWDMRGR